MLHRALVLHCLERDDDLRVALKGDEAELVSSAEVFHGERGGLLRVVEWRTGHGAAAVEHEAEGGRARPGLGDGVGADAHGEEHGAGLIG